MAKSRKRTVKKTNKYTGKDLTPGTYYGDMYLRERAGERRRRGTGTGTAKTGFTRRKRLGKMGGSSRSTSKR